MFSILTIWPKKCCFLVFFCQRVRKQGFEKLAIVFEKKDCILGEKKIILSPFYNYYSLSGQCKTVKKNESSWDSLENALENLYYV